MKTDLRTFIDPFALRLQQTQWQLAALQARMAQQQQRQAALVALRQRLLEQLVPRAEVAARRSLDLVQRRVQLAHLAHLRQACVALQQRIDAMAAVVETLRGALGRCQHELDALERERDEGIAEHRARQQRREHALADQHWLAQRRGAASPSKAG